jgi:DNA-binding MarR family transcriptional regulator
MSITRLPKDQVRARGGAYTAPPIISAPSLTRAGSDRAFQKLVFDIFTISARMEQINLHLALRMKISGPQFSVLRCVASLQDEDGVSIGVVAEHLHVTSTFITAQSRLLAQREFLTKKEDAVDRRVALLSLTPAGEHLVDEVVYQVRPINNMFFGILQKSEFTALSAIMEKLVGSSRNAIVHLSSENEEASLSNRDKRMAAD